MARILYSGVAGVDMSGKVNGSVFSKNKGGSYVRTKVTPVNPKSTAQQNVRNILSTWSQAWRGLTQAQRNGWINQAPFFPYSDRFGFTRQLSGSGLYIKLNANLNFADASGIDDAPAPVAIPAITTLSVAANAGAGNVVVTFAPSPIPADFSLVIRATPNIGAGRNFVKNKFRNITVAGTGQTTPLIMTTVYTNVFGVPVIDEKIFIQAFLVSIVTGQTGIPLQAECIVGS